MNIYCKLIESNGCILTYKYGGYTSDMTGVVEFKAITGEYIVKKRPDKSFVREANLDKIARRVRTLYEKGIVKDKLSHEVG